MNNLDDLKTIWHKAKTDSLPTSDAMISTVKKFKGQKLRNKWSTIIVSGLSFCIIIAALYIVPFKLLTTYMGGGMMALSSVLLAGTNIKSLKRFQQLRDCSNLEFVSFLEQTRQNQLYYYKKTQVVVMLFTSVGLLLYIYELTLGNTTLFICIYSVCTVYLAIMWFYVRHRYFIKNAKKLDETLLRLQSISKQLN